MGVVWMFRGLGRERGNGGNGRGGERAREWNGCIICTCFVCIRVL